MNTGIFFVLGVLLLLIVLAYVIVVTRPLSKRQKEQNALSDAYFRATSADDKYKEQCGIR